MMEPDAEPAGFLYGELIYEGVWLVSPAAYVALNDEGEETTVTLVAENYCAARYFIKAGVITEIAIFIPN